MEIDRRELKRQAREAIRGSRPSFWVVTLVYLLMTTGVSTLAGLLVPAPGHRKHQSAGFVPFHPPLPVLHGSWLWLYAMVHVDLPEAVSRTGRPSRWLLRGPAGYHDLHSDLSPHAGLVPAVHPPSSGWS